MEDEKYEVVEYRFLNGRRVQAKLQSFICETLVLHDLYPFTNEVKKMPGIPKEARMQYRGIHNVNGHAIRIFIEVGK